MIDTISAQLQSSDPQIRREGLIAAGRSRNSQMIPLLESFVQRESLPELIDIAQRAIRYIKSENQTSTPAPSPLSTPSASPVSPSMTPMYAPTVPAQTEFGSAQDIDTWLKSGQPAGQTAGRPERGGCVIIYLLGIVALCLCLFTSLAGVSNQVQLMMRSPQYADLPPDSYQTIQTFASAFLIGIIALLVIQLIGVWMMRQWGRWLAILFNGVMVVVMLCGLANLSTVPTQTYGYSNVNPASVAGTTQIVGFAMIALFGFNVFWFLVNGKKFR
jgi:hypothetical protein